MSRGPSAYQPNTLPLGQTSSQYLELIGESYLYDTCSYTSWIPHSISLSVTSAQSQGGDKVLPLPYLALFSEPAPVPTPVPSSITQVYIHHFLVNSHQVVLRTGLPCTCSCTHHTGVAPSLLRKQSPGGTEDSVVLHLFLHSSH